MWPSTPQLGIYTAYILVIPKYSYTNISSSTLERPSIWNIILATNMLKVFILLLFQCHSTTDLWGTFIQYKHNIRNVIYNAIIIYKCHRTIYAFMTLDLWNTWFIYYTSASLYTGNIYKLFQLNFHSIGYRMFHITNCISNVKIH